MTIKVEGLAELEKALFQLGSTSTARRVGQRALLDAAEPMLEAIRAFAPDDPSTSPSLRDTIKAQPSNKNRRRDLSEVVIGIDGDMIPTVIVPRKRKSKKKRGAVIDLGAFGYGVIQEFGSEKMPANPYFRPGFEATAEQVILLTGRTLGPQIEEAAARQARRAAKAG